MSSMALPIPVWTYLRRFESRRRSQALVRALGQAAALTLAWGLFWCGVDRLIVLPAVGRAIALAVNVGAAGAILSSPLLAMIRRADPAQIARDAERREPAFAQRLETVVSRSVGPASWRGSGDLLAALSAQVSDETARRHPAERLPWGAPLREWGIVLVMALLVIGLTAWSWLDLPTLAKRYTMPLANVPPVTTTRLIVMPGDTTVAEGDPMRIRVLVDRLGDASPVLHIRSAAGPMTGGNAERNAIERSWSEQSMSATPDGAYEARLRNVDRNVEYFISGGDARSEVYQATVLNRPAIAKFRIRYVYPAYTALPAREIDSADGDFEAPAGTEATLTIEATEPLSLAMMTIGGEGLRMALGSTLGERETVARTTFTIREDRRYAIRMASLRGVIGAFRGGEIRAIPDRRPVVRLASIEALRVPAGAATPIGYLAADDYGLARLDVELVIVRAGGAIERRSLAVPGVRGRSAQGEFSLDLKSLNASEGDEIELRLRAEDRAGQFELTDARQLIVNAPGAPAASATPPVAAATTQRSPDTPPIDPPGYDESLRAYFDAVRRMRSE